MAQTILLKRGLAANVGNITPAAGEPVYLTDTRKIHLGDGTTAGGLDIAYVGSEEKGSADGVASLDATGKIPNSQLPALAITTTYAVASEVEQLALVVQEGDVAVRTDINKSYISNGGVAGTMADWQELLTPTDAVQSVNGLTGAVTLTTDEVNEGATNLYYTDTRADSRIQTAIQDTVTSDTTLWSSQKVQDSLSNSLSYKGSWDASLNTPTLSNITGVANEWYKVSVAGTQDLGSGAITFNVGDDVIHDGTVWEQFGSTNAVESVNSKTGIVELNGSDITISTFTGAETGAITTTDSVDAALAKLENGLTSSITDLGYTVSAVDGIITNTSGTDATIPSVNSTNAGLMLPTDKVKLDGIASGAEANVQSDWTQADAAQDSYILNKPTDITNLSTHSISELADVTVLEQLAGDILKWDGSVWHSASSLISINEITDVDTATTPPANGQVLTWDGTSKWVPQGLPSGVTTFLALSDTNNSFATRATNTNIIVQVNAAGDALEYSDISVIDGGTF